MHINDCEYKIVISKVDPSLADQNLKLWAYLVMTFGSFSFSHAPYQHPSISISIRHDTTPTTTVDLSRETSHDPPPPHPSTISHRACSLASETKKNEYDYIDIAAQKF